MTTSADSPEAKARRIMERQLERNAFALDANARRTIQNSTVDLTERLELLAARKELEKLARMLGMEPAEFAPQEVAR